MIRKTFAAACGARKEEPAMNQEKIGRNTRHGIPAIALVAMHPQRRDFRASGCEASAAALDYTSSDKHKKKNA
jgi:hypothetical protein